MELVIWVAFLVCSLIILAFTLYAYQHAAYLAIFLFLLGGCFLLITGLSGLRGFEIENAKNTSANTTNFNPVNLTTYNSTGGITSISTTYIANQTIQRSVTDWKTIGNEYTRALNFTLIFFAIGWILFGIVNLSRQKGRTEIN